MRKIQIGPDYTDPENRFRRHEQKVIEYIRSRFSGDEFKEWLTGYLYEEEKAEVIFEQVSAYLKRVSGDMGNQAPRQLDAGTTAGFGRSKGQDKATDRAGRYETCFGNQCRGNQEHDGPLDPWFYMGVHRKVGF